MARDARLEPCPQRTVRRVVGTWLAIGLLALRAGSAMAAPANAPMAATPDVKQLLARNLAARGGAEAWRKVQSMGWTGRIEAAASGTPALSFLMLFRRPNATRFEIAGKGQRSIRIFDGQQGWKVRPGSETGLDTQPYTDDELASARDAGGLDGPLCDSAAKGITVALEGPDVVEGNQAWRLRVTLPSGQVQRHWLDARSSLVLRYDRVSRNADGGSGIVSVYYRNYQRIQGLNLPLVIETRRGSDPSGNQMIIEKVAINPVLDAGAFTGPASQTRHGGVVVDTAKPPGAGPRGP